jgi:hypothetical protein
MKEMQAESTANHQQPTNGYQPTSIITLVSPSRSVRFFYSPTRSARSSLVGNLSERGLEVPRPIGKMKKLVVQSRGKDRDKGRGKGQENGGTASERMVWIKDQPGIE